MVLWQKRTRAILFTLQHILSIRELVASVVRHRTFHHGVFRAECFLLLLLLGPVRLLLYASLHILLTVLCKATLTSKLSTWALFD